MTISQISPDAARRLIADGALLVDVRDRDEHARERIAGALNLPLSELRGRSVAHDGIVLFHCRSGLRTSANGAALAGAAGGEAYVVDGGLDAWKKAGLPVETDRRAPIEIMRQVQIAAGSLVLSGATLGHFLNPAFYGLSAFVGAGLIFAGVSGTCMMAHALRRAPWNRTASSAA
jgi:rhodanese-related sulfurtransferase